MNKKYSVFVSSTYEDLKEERQEVVNALLKMDCFPVGMEYFNASDKSQWEVIKNLIEECDYYILIIAGRYGSVEPISGKSYTQMEFEYAKSIGVPTISFIHEHPENLPDKYTEKEYKEELAKFREIAKNSLVCHWNTKGDLTKDVVLSLIGEFKTHPRIGWMRADEKSSNEQNKELLRLREEIETLKARIKKYEEQGPEGIADLCQGEDEFTIDYMVGMNSKVIRISLTWNKICSALLPILMQDCTEFQMKKVIDDYISHVKGIKFVNISDLSFQTIKVQLLALGYIEEGSQPKTKKAFVGIWRLTKYGMNVIMRLNALRKER